MIDFKWRHGLKWTTQRSIVGFSICARNGKTLAMVLEADDGRVDAKIHAVTSQLETEFYSSSLLFFWFCCVFSNPPILSERYS